MNEKELKRLSRKDLLEILLAQLDRIEELEKETEKLNKELNNKNINIVESGSIAEASLKLADIFAKADEAVSIYEINAKKQIEKAKNKELKDLDKYIDKKKKEADNILKDAKKIKKEKELAEKKSTKKKANK